MLRGLVAALLLANVLFWSWTQGWLDGLTGIPAGGAREPERLARQVRPEVMRIVPPGGGGGTRGATGSLGSTVSSVGSAAPDCLESGPLTPELAGKAHAALTSALPDLAAGRLANLPQSVPGRWILYMGRFADEAAVARKEEELGRMRSLEFERLPADSELWPGLSLGGHASRAAAVRALERLEERGIRTARVVTLQPPRTEHLLRLEPAGEGWTQRLAAVNHPAVAGLRFAACTSQAPVATASGVASN